MAILDAANSSPPTVQCVREVRAGLAIESLERMRWFYADLLGMPPWPKAAQLPGAWGVGPARCGLLFQYCHDPDVDPNRRRFVLNVPSLVEVEKKLHEHDWPFQRIHGLGVTDHYLSLLDPAGHRVEIRSSQPM